MRHIALISIIISLFSCSNDTEGQCFCDEALSYFNKGNFIKAKELYFESLRIDSSDYIAYNGIGRCFCESGSTDSAIYYYTKSIEFNQSYRQAYHNRGLCYRRLEDYEKALPDFNKSLKLDQNHYYSIFNRGICYRYLGKYELAKNDFDRAIEINPQNSDAYISRAILTMEESGDFQNYKAIEDWIKVLELNDSVPENIKKELEELIRYQKN